MYLVCLYRTDRLQINRDLPASAWGMVFQACSTTSGSIIPVRSMHIVHTHQIIPKYSTTLCNCYVSNENEERPLKLVMNECEWDRGKERKGRGASASRRARGGTSPVVDVNEWKLPNFLTPAVLASTALLCHDFQGIAHSFYCCRWHFILPCLLFMLLVPAVEIVLGFVMQSLPIGL